MSFLAKLKTSLLFNFIRKYKYRKKRRSFVRDPKLCLASLEHILTNELHVKLGDTIIVQCGFGFLNAGFTPTQLINLLAQIVGEEGHIAMPYYPPGLSSDWATANRTFQPGVTKSSVGVLSELFAVYPSVIVSAHPIKAMSILGPRAHELAGSHHLSVYPFDKHSPYAKIAEIQNSKTIGLGVRNCSMFHCAEDLYESDKSYLYGEKEYGLQVNMNESTIVVNTKVHRPDVKLCTSDRFFEVNCPDIVKIIHVDKRVFYSINNSDLLSKVGQLLLTGVNRSNTK